MLTTLKVLWRRAPIWRFCLMSAALLTLLFALFPPIPATRPVKSPPDNLTMATYQTLAPTSNSSPPVTSRPTQPPSPPPSSTPRTANLAMVTAGKTKSSDESGLDPALLGPSYRGAVTIDGFTIPLPPGAWANLAHITIHEQSATGDAHFLGQIRNRRLIGAVRIFAVRSDELPGAGFNEVRSCTETNPGRTFVSIDDEMVPHGHQSCWTIRDVYATPWSQWADRATKLSSLDRAAAGDMAAKGVTFPQDFISLTFTRTETWGLLEVGYLFSPDSEGITSNAVLAVTETDWTPTNINRYPEKLAYIEKLKAWGVLFWPKFKAAFAAGAPASNPAQTMQTRSGKTP